MRTIDADALLVEFDRREAEPEYQHEGEDWHCGLISGEELVMEAPTVEPERKKGKWLANGDIPKECSFCGEDWDKYVFGDIWYTGELPKFCPNYGAEMESK